MRFGSPTNIWHPFSVKPTGQLTYIGSMDTTSQAEEILDEVTEGTVPEPEVPPVPTDDVAQSMPVDDDSLNEDLFLSDDARRSRWQSRKPSAEHLKVGTVSTVIDAQPADLPLFTVGDRIVVECRTRFLKRADTGELCWLETLVGKVRSIDDDTGAVSLFDEESDPRSPVVRHVSLKDPAAYSFFLAPARGNPFTATAVRQAAKPVVPPVVIDGVEQPKRGRGRPPGSKNRPKEVIKAEREAYKAAKAEKKGKRR